MHQDDSPSSAATEPLGQSGPGKLEKFLLVCPGFFVFVAGIVFLARSPDLYSICDASLMFLIGIGWVVGCRKMSQLESELAESGKEKRHLEALRIQAKDTSKDLEGQLTGILRQTPFIMGAVELDGDVVRSVYENAASQEFFAKALTGTEDQPMERSVARIETIRGWLKCYQETSWIKTPVSLEHEYIGEEGTQWLRVSIAQIGKNGSGPQRFCYFAEDATDKKKAHKALVQSNEQLGEILDTNMDTVLSVNREWRVSYVNARAMETLGYGREILGRILWDLHPSWVGTAAWTECSKAMTERTAVEFDVCGGEGAQYQVRALPCRGGLVIFLRDVSSDREAINTLVGNERELRRRLAEHETLYQTAPMCLAVFDRHLRFVRINKTLAEVNGVRIEATLGRTLGEILPYYYEQIAPLLTFAMETGESVHAQFANARRGEGEAWRHCLTNAHPVRDEMGNIAGVSLMLLDTTAEQKAEQALRESEQRFRQLAEGLPEIVWTADADGNIDYCNGRWYAYTRCSGGNVASEWNNFIHPADLANWRESWERSTRSGEDCEIEYQFLRYDGIYRWFLCRAQAVSGNDGQILKWFGTCSDIHQQKETEQMLRYSNDGFKQLTAAASHDLQEHLHHVDRFCAHANQYQGRVGVEAERHLETIVKSATPLNLLLEDLRSFSTENGERRGRYGTDNLAFAPRLSEIAGHRSAEDSDSIAPVKAAFSISA